MSSTALIPEIVSSEAPLLAAPRTGEVINEETDKTLLRMTQLWGKLDEGQRKAFRRFIDGVGEIDTGGQLIGAGEAARILRTTFYEVKRLAREGILPAASVKDRGRYAWQPKDGDARTYRFRRADVVNYAHALKVTPTK